MKSKYYFFKLALSLLVVIGIIYACNGDGERKKIVERNERFSSEPVSNIRVIPLNGSGYMSDWERQNDIAEKITQTLASGKYNVVEVRTRYQYNYLISAEIVYDTVPGDNNALRFLFISYKRFYYFESEVDYAVKQKLNEIQKDGSKVIEKIKTTYNYSSLRSAEVYYKDRTKD